MSGAQRVYDQTLRYSQLALDRCGEWGQVALSQAMLGAPGLIGMKMPDPNAFHNAEDFAYAYQSWCALRKISEAPGLNPALLRNSAKQAFVDSEVACGQVNSLPDSFPYLECVALEQQPQSLIESARRFIARALGDISGQELQRSCEFSNGASTGCSRKRGHPAFKLGDGGRKPHVTIGCRELALGFIQTSELWRKTATEIWGPNPFDWVEVVPGSKFDSVPKTVKTDRPICVEPDLNMFFQKGIGYMIRQRLKRVGIDLNQQEYNQVLAYEGSVDGVLATIDLSSASDSVSLRCCELLLPQKWFDAIRLTRSPKVLLPEGWVALEKVSSMGNGFTFELESLLFWGLLKAARRSVNCTEAYSVYGDDIVCSAPAARVLIPLLRSLGFATNDDKTFVDGPFRESCGKHYFQGVDVTPFHIKKPIVTWADHYHYANNVSDWLRARGLDDDIPSIVHEILKKIPPSKRCYVPRSYGSKAGLICDNPQGVAKWRRRGRRPFVWAFRTLVHVQSEHEMSGPFAYLSSMLMVEQEEARFLDGVLRRSDCVYQDDGPRGASVFGVRAVGEGHYRVRVAHVSVWE